MTEENETTSPKSRSSVALAIGAGLLVVGAGAFWGVSGGGAPTLPNLSVRTFLISTATFSLGCAPTDSQWSMRSIFRFTRAFLSGTMGS